MENAKRYVKFRREFQLARALSIAFITMLLMLGTGARLYAETRPANSGATTLTAQARAECTAGGSATIARHSATGNLRFAGAEAGQALRITDANSAASAEQAARNYLVACGALFGISDARNTLNTSRERTEGDGGSNVRYQQTYNGIPVLAGEILVNMDAGRNVTSVAGEVLTDVHVDTQPQVDAGTASATALQQLAAHYGVDEAGLSAGEPSLWVYNPALISPHGGFTELVWRMEVKHATQPDIRALVLVNAHRGNIALQFNQTDFARNRKTYSANHGTTLPGTLKCNEANSDCGGDAHAAAAHKYAAHAYDFYLNNLGRDSIDNKGMDLISIVHYGNNYFNANWNGEQMIYGDAAGFPLADDVVGHELTHGVTQYESNLFYYYQSGAINESLSDVFGELVDLSNGDGDDSDGVRWQIGEDILGNGALRDMKDPGVFGDPDKMSSPNYYTVTCDDWTTSCDNGGVHFNSGVNNKAAYLLVDGGSFNGKSVSGIGILKTAKIYYEAQRNFLSTGSDYADLYNALYQGCQSLIGTSGITGGDCQQVRNATDAVEMNSQPLPGYNPDAAICDSGSPSDVFFDDLEGSAGDWSFGAISGTSAWSLDGYDYLAFPHAGVHFLYGDDFNTNSNSFVAMKNSVALPANAYLHFFHAYGFESPNEDGGILEYSTNNGSSWTNASSLIQVNGYDGNLAGSNVMGAIPAWLSDSHGYISTRANLGSLAGQNVRFRWRLGTNSFNFDYGWFLDDVRIYTCGGAAGPVTTDEVRVTNKANEDLSDVHRGDKVFYRVTLHNGGSVACNITLRLLVKNKSSVLTDKTKTYTVHPGNQTIKLKQKIQTDAPFIKYTAKAASNCNGQKDSAKDKFNIVP